MCVCATGHVHTCICTLNASFSYKCTCTCIYVSFNSLPTLPTLPTLTGLYLDAQAGLDFLISRRDIDNKKIILFGRSLGGAVAISLAASHPHKESVMALVIENTFTSIPKMAQLMFPGASSFPLLCFKNKVGVVWSMWVWSLENMSCGFTRS